MKKLVHASPCLLALTAGMHTISALAAEDIASPGAIDVVRVTAQRRAEPIQQVPMSVDALTSNDLEIRGLRGTHELDQQIPGLQVSYGAQLVFSLRGVSMSDFNSTQASPIGVYLDEGYLGAISTHSLSFFDLERVEVLKGPQGTLYGKNTTGGAINIQSRSPALNAQTSGEFKAGFGTYGARQLFAAGETSPLAGRFALRAALDYEHDNGWIKNRLGPNMAQIDRFGMRVTANAQLSAELNALLKITHSHSNPQAEPYRAEGLIPVPGLGHVDLAGYARPAGLGYRETENNRVGRNLRDLDHVTLRLKYQGGSFDLIALSSWYTARFRSEFDGDGSPNALAEPTWDFDGHAASQDLRMESTWTGPFSMIGGIYFNRERKAVANTYRLFETPLPVLMAVDPALAGMLNQFGVVDHRMRTAADSAAGYFQGRYRLTDKLAVDSGLRYTVDENDLDYINISQLDYQRRPTGSWIPGNTSGIDTAFLPVGAGGKYLVGPYTTASGPLRHAREKRWSGKLSLDYQFGQRAMFYANYNKGFRSGAYNPGLFYAAEAIQKTGYTQPETISATEAGLKSETSDRRLKFNLAVYDYRYDNQQFINVVGVSSQLLNAGAAQIRGVEISAAWRVSEKWRATTGLNLMNTKYSSLVLGPDHLTGNELISAPKTKINGSLDYRSRVTDAHMLELNLGGSYQSRQWYSAYNGINGYDRIGQKAYGLLNARAALAGNRGGYTLALNVSNLLNRHYDTYALKLAGFGLDAFMQGSPRRVNVSFAAYY